MIRCKENMTRCKENMIRWYAKPPEFRYGPFYLWVASYALDQWSGCAECIVARSWKESLRAVWMFANDPLSKTSVLERTLKSEVDINTGSIPSHSQATLNQQH
ncbi:hypothetical protein LOZ58_006222 [Ophidiomyces ophidiicola]|nr:hypothetical protein LOZ58_006222 [Ophidiomyces ophidiicola]